MEQVVLDLFSLAWILLPWAVGYMASKKGRSFWGWVILAYVFNPLLMAGLLFSFFPPLRACVFCGHKISVTATTCKHCGQACSGEDYAAALSALSAQADAQESRDAPP